MTSKSRFLSPSQTHFFLDIFDQPRHQVDGGEEESVASLRRKVVELEAALAENHRGGREVEIMMATIANTKTKTELEAIHSSRGGRNYEDEHSRGGDNGKDSTEC